MNPSTENQRMQIEDVNIHLQMCTYTAYMYLEIHLQMFISLKARGCKYIRWFSLKCVTIRKYCSPEVRVHIEQKRVYGVETPHPRTFLGGICCVCANLQMDSAVYVHMCTCDGICRCALTYMQCVCTYEGHIHMPYIDTVAQDSADVHIYRYVSIQLCTSHLTVRLF